MDRFEHKFSLVERNRETGRGFNLGLELLKWAAMAIALHWLMGALGNLLAYRVLRLDASNGAVRQIVFLSREGIGLGLLLGLSYGTERMSPALLGFTKRGAVRRYLLGALVGLGMISVTVGLGALLGGFRYAGWNAEASPRWILAFLLAYLLQGMFEEALFRSYFVLSLSRKNPVWASVLLSAVVFALLHGANYGFGPLPALNLTLFGLFAALYLLRSGNIWGIGAVHAMWNFGQGCLYGLSVSGAASPHTLLRFAGTSRTLLSGGDFGPEGGLPVTLVFALGAALLLWLGFRREKE